MGINLGLYSRSEGKLSKSEEASRSTSNLLKTYVNALIDVSYKHQIQNRFTFPSITTLFSSFPCLSFASPLPSVPFPPPSLTYSSIHTLNTNRFFDFYALCCLGRPVVWMGCLRTRSQAPCLLTDRPPHTYRHALWHHRSKHSFFLSLSSPLLLLGNTAASLESDS